MATTLNKAQIGRRLHAKLPAEVLLNDKPLPISKESDLCDLFIREFNNIDGWVCYPEAANFDVLVVHQDGRQIGVQAKLTLNAKVADQVLPNYGDDYFARPGPDHRLVIVSKVTEASAGIVKMLRRLGVKVLCPRSRWGRSGYEYTFDLQDTLLVDEVGCTHFGRERLFDWSPIERCYIPAIIQDLPAGVPAPIRLTPWKEAAIKIVALMRYQGFITAKQIAEHGVGTSKWTQAPRGEHAWLAKGVCRGQWVETEHMPPFDKQHPALYAMAVDAVAAAMQKEFTLA